MSRRVRKLTPSKLKRMIKEEAKKLQTELSDPVAKGGDIEKVSAEEVEAEDLADTLEQDIDYLKVLKIHEAKLVKKLSRLREAKTRLRSRITKSI
jgi:septal ring factor EnvC (AmiA/AmiB activator)